MKSTLSKFVLFITILSFFFSAYAEDGYKKLSLSVSIIYINMELENEFKEDNPISHRIPSGNTECGISPGAGVKISGNELKILSYEIWTPDGETCIFKTDAENDFVSILFTLTGDFELRFYTDDHLYIGYVTL